MPKFNNKLDTTTIISPKTERGQESATMSTLKVPVALDSKVVASKIDKEKSTTPVISTINETKATTITTDVIKASKALVAIHKVGNTTERLKTVEATSTVKATSSITEIKKPLTTLESSKLKNEEKNSSEASYFPIFRVNNYKIYGRKFGHSTYNHNFTVKEEKVLDIIHVFTDLLSHLGCR